MCLAKNSTPPVTKLESKKIVWEKLNLKFILFLIKAWGYGILFVGLISLSSLCGAVVIPFSNKKIYKKILMFLIGVAIGSLAGSGFLHLIPQVWEIKI